MHFHAEIHLNEEEYDDGEIEEYWTNPDSFWDWWQIGGRWSGVHKPRYDPSKDERNIQSCRRCHGTGTYESQTCYFCKGTKQEVKWPTQWVETGFDVMPLENVPDDLTCYTLIVDGHVFHAEGRWIEEKKTFEKLSLHGKPVKEFLAKMDITDGYLVTVDYHR